MIFDKLQCLANGIGTTCKYVLIFGAGFITTECLSFIYYKLVQRAQRRSQIPPEVRIMGKNSIQCRHCVHRKIACSETCNFATLTWMLEMIDSARTYLDVCMHSFDHPDFADAVIRAKNRGCRVRLITKWEMTDSGMLLRIRRAGVMVHTMDPPSTGVMHMTLVIVDLATVLTGSVNFTVAAFSGNSEEVICFRDVGTVAKYLEWFHLRWADFDYNDRMVAMIQNHGQVPQFQR